MQRAPDDPAALCSRLRKEWVQRVPFPVTFSAGWAIVSSGEQGQSALARADRALYVAKSTGRDRAMGAPQEAGHIPSLQRGGPMTVMETETLTRFLDYAYAGDRRAAAAMAVELLDDGTTIEDLIEEVFVPAQREVGERWHQNRTTVADEHLATSVVQSALEAAAAASLASPSGSASALVACAEGDWHSLPARMMTEILEAAGVPTNSLGASTPTEHVAGFLADHRPTALVVTCSVPLFYEGAVRLIERAHALGIPVMAGGRAVTDYGLARVLGADAGPSTPEDALAQLGRWAKAPPSTLQPTGLNTDCGLEEPDIDDASVSAFEILARGLPVMAVHDDAQKAKTSADLAYILRFARAAVLVREPKVFTDFMDWQRRLLAARSVPISALDAGVTALLGVVGGTPVGEMLTS